MASDARSNQVPHYWIADPVEKTLIVHRWEPRGYLVALTAALGDVVRAKPFESTELRISILFGIDDEEEENHEADPRARLPRQLAHDISVTGRRPSPWP